jgi:hypothetical protein
MFENFVTGQILQLTGRVHILFCGRLAGCPLCSAGALLLFVVTHANREYGNGKTSNLKTKLRVLTCSVDLSFFGCVSSIPPCHNWRREIPKNPNASSRNPESEDSSHPKIFLYSYVL